ncbi:hypothetical protein Gohar_010304 [Gossypium harknessii]|uniref:Uncharacterized protein n=1 Tax=Gossypium harknessii TaxID=34285 RepID=A0A7J9GSR0_9ROSI|nr:hypothetical protein [Gossypium harknessii]
MILELDILRMIEIKNPFKY